MMEAFRSFYFILKQLYCHILKGIGGCFSNLLARKAHKESSEIAFSGNLDA